MAALLPESSRLASMASSDRGTWAFAYAGFSIAQKTCQCKKRVDASNASCHTGITSDQGPPRKSPYSTAQRGFHFRVDTRSPRLYPILMDLSGWRNKHQAAAILNRSSKQVERYSAKGLLTRRMRERTGTNGTTEVVYDPADVERLRVQLVNEKEAELARVQPSIQRDEETAVSVTRPASLQPFLRALQRLPQATPLYLSWRDARRYSGLSEATLRQAVADRKVATLRYGGGVRLRRLDLDKL